jgi:transposase InsO family protein
VQLHANAKLTVASRRRLVGRVRVVNGAGEEGGGAAGGGQQTAHKWLHRYDKGGELALQDRSSRPHRIARKTAPAAIRRMERLRRRRKAAWEISEETGIPTSTVSRHLKRIGLGRIWRIEEAEEPVRRYEHTSPGSLLHIDAKKFARIDGVGHRIHGNRAKKKRGVGWEVVFVCVDDYTRLAYAEVHPSENARCAVVFFRRALRWFRSLGIDCRRLLSDNAKCYANAKAFHALCEAEGIRQSFTRSYRPQTNGKAERFIQTLKRRWAYRYVYRTSAMRAASLRPWVTHYNHQRPHRALGKKPPIARLRAFRQQAA